MLTQHNSLLGHLVREALPSNKRRSPHFKNQPLHLEVKLIFGNRDTKTGAKVVEDLKWIPPSVPSTKFQFHTQLGSVLLNDGKSCRLKVCRFEAPDGWLLK